ncbi:MAG: cohesin domain-containing protein [bacterium]|nr:cohesin domain-containing protein [bacterium]
MLREFDKKTALFCALILILLAGSALAETNIEPNLFYIDTVKAGPGQDIPVRFYVKNDRPLSALTLPIVYDSDLLTLREIDFSGSRAEYINTKLVTPDSMDQIDGHFKIGIIKVFEDALPVGDGLIFTALFTVSDTITERVLTSIDTLAFPPAGELIFVADDSGTTSILPAFEAGQVYIDAANEAPRFAEVADRYVIEGDSLEFNLTVIDPNSDPVRIVCTESPAGVSLVDDGKGSAHLTWLAPFVGPGSADNGPFTFGFWATDGDLSDRIEVVVSVLNRNRAPEVTVMAADQMLAGDSLVISFSAEEPDFESFSWDYLNLPVEAVFDRSVAGRVVWPSTVVDTGTFEFGFVATDLHGLADTGLVTVTVLPVDLFTLSMDTISAFPNATIEVRLHLDNKQPVSAFNLLFNYDPLALTILDVVNNGTRSENFEQFLVTFDDEGVPGNIRIQGTADVGGGTAILPPATGSIARIQFHIVNNVTLGGTAPPLRFVSSDSVNWDDNTVNDSLGFMIPQSEVVTEGSYVNILEVGLIVIGDINLNGIPFEIGDAIYFGNYFMDPSNFPFNIIQYANSDVNHDDLVATVADLIALINVIIDGGPSAKVEAAADLKAVLYVDQQDDRVVLSYDANFEVGGLFLEYNSAGENSADQVNSLFANIDLLTAQDGAQSRVLLFSMDGVRMPQGEHPFAELIGSDQFESAEIQLASSAGQLVRAEVVRRSVGLPTQFNLGQNYPNPFNPETNINFDLPAEAHVQMTVFNVLGRKVKVLIDGRLPAGSHIITWDGRDDNSHPVASGLYLYRLVAGNESESRKMMLLK